MRSYLIPDDEVCSRCGAPLSIETGWTGFCIYHLPVPPDQLWDMFRTQVWTNRHKAIFMEPEEPAVVSLGEYGLECTCPEYVSRLTCRHTRYLDWIMHFQWRWLGNRQFFQFGRFDAYLEPQPYSLDFEPSYMFTVDVDGSGFKYQQFLPLWVVGDATKWQQEAHQHVAS